MATKRKRSKPAPPLPPKPSPETYRGWQNSLSEREKRIEEIFDHMMRGAWLTGVTEKHFAKRWRLSPNTIRKMSAEASRMVRKAIRTDPEAQADARAAMLQIFEVIRAKAMANGHPNGLRVALDATRAYGFYLGIEPAKRFDINPRVDEFEGWTPQEKLAYAETGRKPRRAARMTMQTALAAADDDRIH